MITKTTTIVLTGTTKADYEKIVQVLREEAQDTNGWELTEAASTKTVTAVKVEQVEAL